MRSILFVTFSLFFSGLISQSITATVSSDSILIGNTIKVTFTIENSESTFTPPSFDENMTIVGGPNNSNSIQITNGHRTSRQSITYFLKPNLEGQFFIPPSSITDATNILETDAIEINVYPNPDGIINNIEIDNNFFFESMDLPSMDFNLEDFFGKNPQPQLKREEPVQPKSKSKQKTRKI